MVFNSGFGKKLGLRDENGNRVKGVTFKYRPDRATVRAYKLAMRRAHRKLPAEGSD